MVRERIHLVDRERAYREPLLPPLFLARSLQQTVASTERHA